MGRELRRKQAKKEGKSLKKEISSENNQVKKLLMIIILLIFIICSIYLISALFVTKELDWFEKNKNEVKENLVNNTILISETFKQKEEEYYVYFYDYKKEDAQITSTIDSKLHSKKVYKVDTNSALNNKYVSEESNKLAKTLNDLKVKSPTIIKITNEIITEYYEGEEIISNLK